MIQMKSIAGGGDDDDDEGAVRARMRGRVRETPVPPAMARMLVGSWVGVGGRSGGP